MLHRSLAKTDEHYVVVANVALNWGAAFRTVLGLTNDTNGAPSCNEARSFPLMHNSCACS